MDGRQGTPLARVGPCSPVFPSRFGFFRSFSGPAPYFAGEPCGSFGLLPTGQERWQSQWAEEGGPQEGSCGLAWMGDVWANQLYPILGKSDPSSPHLADALLLLLLLPLSFWQSPSSTSSTHSSPNTPSQSFLGVFFLIFNRRRYSWSCIVWLLVVISFFILLLAHPSTRNSLLGSLREREIVRQGKPLTPTPPRSLSPITQTTDLTLPTDIDRLESFFFPRLIFVNLPVPPEVVRRNTGSTS